MKHLLSIEDLGAADIHASAGAHRPHGRDHRSGRSRRCRRSAARTSSACSSRTHPHTHQLRHRGQTAQRRHDELRRVVEQRQQGREPARHHRDHRGDGRRCVRRAPQVERGAAADHHWTNASIVNAGDGWHSTRHRRCSTATRSAPTSTAATVSTACASPSSATSSTAESRAATSMRSRRLALTSPSLRLRRCCLRRSTAGRSMFPTTSTSSSRPRRAVSAARATRAHGRCLAAKPARVLRDVRAHRPAGRRVSRRTRWSCIPGR